MKENVKYEVPTFNGYDGEEDFTPTDTPVSVCYEDGLRIFLGEHVDSLSDAKPETPDLVIERRRNGWMILIRSRCDADDDMVVGIMDGGYSRVYVCPQGDGELGDYAEWVDDLDRKN